MYLDTPALQAANLNTLREMGVESPLFELSASANGASVIGLTLLDDRSLVIDTASQINPDAFGALDIEMFTPAPVDPAFAERVPADAPFVILGSDLGQSWAVGLENLRRLDAFIVENGGWDELLGPTLDFQTRAALRGFTLNAALGAVNVGFAGLTGLSLENDVLPMFTGNFALFARAVDDDALTIIPDVGFVTEVSDPDLAFANLAQLREAFDAYGTPYTVETLDDNGQVIAAQWLRSLAQTDSPNVDIVFGTDGVSFALGTRRAVLGARDSLSNDPAYLAAQAYFLPDSVQIGYIGGDALTGLIDQLRESGLLPLQTVSDLDALRPVLSGIESASFSGAYVGESATIARFVVTLAE
jgi:hypothetical protein